MMRFEGDRQFQVEPAMLWNQLRDTRFLASCIPDASLEGDPQPDRVVCSVRPGLAFVRGSLEVTLAITRAEPDTALAYLVTSKGIGSSSTVAVDLAFTESGEKTQVHWSAEVQQLGGLLKAVPGGLIRGAAQKVIEDLWRSIETKVA